jgi:hypothetical protein
MSYESELYEGILTCGFGISDFGNKEKYLYFLQNIEVYTSEIQHPISEISGFTILRTPSYEL